MGFFELELDKDLLFSKTNATMYKYGFSLHSYASGDGNTTNTSSTSSNVQGEQWPEALEIMFQVLQIITSVAILTGNTLTIAVLVRFERLRTKTHAIVCSLSAADLTVGFTHPVYYIFNYAVSGTSISNYDYCVLIHAIHIFPMLNSAFHLIFIAIERHIAVTRPLHYHAILTKSAIVVTLACAWIISLFLAVMPFFWIDKTRATAASCSIASFPVAYFFAFLFGPFVAMTMSMIVIYVRIFWVARKHIQQIQAQIENRKQEKRKQVRELKAAKLLSMTVGAFIVCWYPFAIYLALLVVNVVVMNSYVFKFSLLLAVANSAVNFFIYVAKSTEFRNAFRALFCSCSKCVKQSEAEINVSYISHRRSTIPTADFVNKH